MNQTTVLIIGAGPVGLTLACELARRNVPFRIIERNVTAPQGSRAKALQPRSLEIFNDLGIADELMQEGSTTLPYRRYFDTKLVGDQQRNPIVRTDTKYPKILLLPQTAVEAALRNKLEELGGTIEWATELADFSQTDAGITCRLEHPNWSEELTSTYMVACDGGKGTTRKKLGINFVGETHQDQQLWVGDVEVEGLAPDAWYNWFSSKFGLAFALFPFKNSSKWQLQAALGPDESGNIPTPTLEGFNRLLKDRTGLENVTLSNSTWQSIFRVNIRRADRFRVGNAFVAGDAAHVHSIAGGIGMNTGIQDAYNLGWKLAAVINGEADAKLLDTYAEERIPVADWTLKTTSGRQEALLSAATSGKGGFETLSTSDTTQLNLNYPDSSLSQKTELTKSALQAGDRAPDVEIGNGNWLSDQLRGTQWKLLAFDSDVPANIGKKLKVIDGNNEAIINAYGLSTGMVLVRPDGYIALITTNADDIAGYFNTHIN